MTSRVCLLARPRGRFDCLRWTGACLGALFGLAAAPRVEAQSTRDPLLQWTRSRDALGCIDAHTLGLEVETMTGPRLGPARDSNYLIEGQIARSGSGFVATLRVLGDGGAQSRERTLRHDGANCRDFDEALVFVIALMIDPELDLSALIGGPVENPGGALLQELDAVPLRTAPPAPAPARPRVEPAVAQGLARPDPTGWRALAEAGVATVDTPDPLVHVGVAGRRTLGRTLSLQVAAYADSSVSAQGAGPAQLRLVRPGLGAGVCAERARRKDTISGCLAVSPELWLGFGRGFDDDAVGRALRTGFTLEASWLRQIAGDFALGLAASARLQTRSVRFAYEAGGTSETAQRAGIFRASIVLIAAWDLRS